MHKLYARMVSLLRERWPQAAFYRPVFKDSAYSISPDDFQVTEDGRMIAIAAHNGYWQWEPVYSLLGFDAKHRLSWETPLSPASPYPGLLAVCSAVQRIYIHAEQTISAFDFNGNPLWTFTPAKGGVLKKAAADPQTGHIYLIYASQDESSCTWIALHISGQPLWEHSIPVSASDPSRAMEIHLRPAGTVLLQLTNKLYAYSPEGAFQWSYDMHSYTLPNQYGADSIIYMNSGFSLQAVDSTNGNVLWSYQVEDNRDFRKYIDRHYVSEDGTLYLVIKNAPLIQSLNQVNDCSLVAMNSNGRPQWSYALSDDRIQLFLHPHHGIFLNQPNRIRSLHLDGTERWSLLLPSFELKQIHLGTNGHLYFNGFCCSSSSYMLLEYSPEGELLNRYKGRGRSLKKMLNGSYYTVAEDGHAIYLISEPLAI